MVRRIMREFSISEISGVDGPAQKGAKVVIMKRHQEEQEMDPQKVDLGALAMIALKGRAVELRKREPHLTEEQAFAKVYVDPANREAANIERNANRNRAATPIARTEPAVLRDLTDEECKRLANEERRRNPYLTAEQAYARVYSSPAMREHRAEFARTLTATSA